MKLRLSTLLVFNVSSMQWLGLSYTSILVHLHCLQMYFSNSFTGFLLNGIHCLNLPCTVTFKALHTDRPPYLSDLLRHHEPPVLISFQSPATNKHLDLVFFGFLLQEFGIHYLSVFVKLSHFQLSDVIY